MSNRTDTNILLRNRPIIKREYIKREYRRTSISNAAAAVVSDGDEKIGPRTRTRSRANFATAGHFHIPVAETQIANGNERPVGQRASPRLAALRLRARAGKRTRSPTPAELSTLNEQSRPKKVCIVSIYIYFIIK